MTTAIGNGVVPRLRVSDISWRTMGGILLVQLDLVNESSEPTEDAELVIEVAPLGAFVPFKPGTRLAVAGLDPWERRRVTAILRAFEFEDILYGEPTAFRAVNTLTLNGGEWAGNLNVYFERAPEEAVEVHRALGLRVEAGRKVGFGFFLDASEAYALEVHSSVPGWEPEVRALEPGIGMLTLTPPTRPGERATVDVRVTRLSDSRTVPVRFGLETVEGQGETLGCIRA